MACGRPAGRFRDDPSRRSANRIARGMAIRPQEAAGPGKGDDASSTRSGPSAAVSRGSRSRSPMSSKGPPDADAVRSRPAVAAARPSLHAGARIRSHLRRVRLRVRSRRCGAPALRARRPVIRRRIAGADRPDPVRQGAHGWTFDWVSSYGSDFNYDFGVSFTDEQIAAGKPLYNFGTSLYLHPDLPLSVLPRTGQVVSFYTYSTYTRGLELLDGAFNWLDLVPKGRNEGWRRHGLGPSPRRI